LLDILFHDFGEVAVSIEIANRTVSWPFGLSL